jgi:hypothetical protein
MSAREPHPAVLRNFQNALIPESKLRYALVDSDKRKPFRVLGWAVEGSSGWRDLRDALVEGLPYNAAVLSHRDEWGETYDVDMTVVGPKGKAAPVRTKWMYRIGEDFPRLVTLYVRTTDWKRWERERRS